jgi:putative transcriptional regulator
MADSPRDSDSQAGWTGRLLVATPVLRSSPFERRVVLLLDHDADGSLGVVLNDPLEVPVHSVLPSWAQSVSAPDVLFGGGPVSTDAALAVGVLAAESLEPLGWRSMYERVGLIDLDAPHEVIDSAVIGLRVFAGYAGWSAGQLEDEVEEGCWLVVDALQQDLLDGSPHDLWSRVLRRQPDETRLLATYPADPTAN